jgi:hypothetical protein
VQAPVSWPVPLLSSWHSYLFTPVVRFTQLMISRGLILILLLVGGIHPNPGPPLVMNHPSHTSSSQPSSQTFLQWNCNGIRNSSTELNDFIRSHHIKIICLQETKLKASAKCPTFPDYTVLRKDRQVGGGEVLLSSYTIRFLIPSWTLLLFYKAISQLNYLPFQRPLVTPSLASSISISRLAPHVRLVSNLTSLTFLPSRNLALRQLFWETLMLTISCGSQTQAVVRTSLEVRTSLTPSGSVTFVPLI